MERATSYFGRGRFVFLNREADLGLPINWPAESLSLLWQYNLHYFDYLQQSSLSDASGLTLICDWIKQHSPSKKAVGWQPYPISLRVVNWLKFLSHSEEIPSDVAQSLFLQGLNLERQIEFHLLGNHLFANGKALWFLGAALGERRWVATGRRIVLSQLHEQFLPDGGHFELSPMYHAIAIEDLLDLINLCRAEGDSKSGHLLREAAARALGWMEGVVDASARIPLLNDAAHGIAPLYRQLIEYSARLNIQAESTASAKVMDSGWTSRNFSGYRVLQNDSFRVVFDTALLGPDYLPGHAHCDMLSILLAFRGKNVLGDTGVFEYGETARRNYSRSLPAHNTVSLDGFDQADIWKSFRMGKRGRPRKVDETSSEISCEHNAFSKQTRGLKHRRTLRLLPDGIEVIDDFQGPDRHRFDAYLHFEPEITLTQVCPDRFLASSGLLFEISGGTANIANTESYPEFGLVRPRVSLIVSGNFVRSHRIIVRCTSFS